MRRALVLNDGLSLAAYQAGAIRHLARVGELAFDVVAGTGIGAMHGALVACAEAEGIERFWSGGGWRALVRPNLSSPRQGPVVATPQRRFLAAHVSEARLRATGTTLLVQVMHLGDGAVHTLSYPGDPVPLIDGLMAAVSIPGLYPPVHGTGRSLRGATPVESVPLRALTDPRAGELEEVVALLPALPDTKGPSRAYRNWRAVLSRAVAVNQTHDVRAGLARARTAEAALSAHRYVSSEVPARLAAVAESAGGPALAGPLTGIYAASRFATTSGPGPRVTAIVPSQELPYPMWRFRPDEVAWAAALGEQDARRALAARGQEDRR